MPYECGKACMRRLHEPGFGTRYFTGHGIDIGGGYDPLWEYHELFPSMRSCRNWDVEDGDAQLMEGVADEAFDFVHSSHCLEHVRDPAIALQHWFRILRTGGHLIVMVPDEDLYEQGVWPSTYNNDHRRSFTIQKPEGASWSPVSTNITDLVRGLGPLAYLVKAQLLDVSYRYGLERGDQTASIVGECAIEFIVRKLGRPHFMEADG